MNSAFPAILKATSKNNQNNMDMKTSLQTFGIADEVDVQAYDHLLAMFFASVDRYGDKTAYTCLGHSISYIELKQLAEQFACYLQHYTSLQPGDRIAIQLPNILQYPVALYGAWMAGLVVVNTNPLYTPPELKHQLNDAGAKAIVVLANVAKALEQVISDTPIDQVIVTELADLHPMPKRFLINTVVKYVKRMVPRTHFANKVKLLEALQQGEGQTCQTPELDSKSLAVLQYTGGTTGVAKGAMLSHGNLVANTLQCMEIFKTYGLQEGKEVLVMPLPLYHIYSFLVSMILFNKGNQIVLVPDPRNIPELIDVAKNTGMTVFCGINTLFVAMCHHKNFSQIDFEKLHLTLSGGMALTQDVATQWHELTGTEIYQGYGLTETSPVVAVNPGGGNQMGTIGLPVPNTQIRLMGHEGEAAAEGEPGELCVKGPQVMQGYWNMPEETAKVINGDGWLHTGDIAVQTETGYLRIVDRIKDMIVVSGFKVYPNEVEDVVSSHPLVVECAVIGIPDEHSGEAVKLFVVPESKAITERELIDFCKKRLTGYKVPKAVEFRDSLPKSNVGKILRKELRDSD